MFSLATKTYRVSLALLLSFWIAGAGCLFGCSEMALASSDVKSATPTVDSLATVVASDACASNGSHDCCAKKRAARQAKTQNSNSSVSLQLATLLSLSESLNSVPSNGVRECPLALSRAIAITKASDRKQFADGITTLPAKALAAQTSREFKATVAPAARLPNRGHTYLRCCTFLI